MKAKERPFFDLFNQTVQYLVPRWQRRYVWGEKEIDRLINDLLAIADAENQERPHYGGTMITVQESGSPVMRVHRVVDGQQRLATVSILLACIAETLGADGGGGDLSPEDIRDDLLTNPKKPEAQRRKLRLQDGDEEEYRRIIEGSSAGVGEGSVAEAWRVVRKRVNSENVQALVKGLHRLRVITIALDERDDAQQIFESLNATGKALTEGEKVKNWLLMGLSEGIQDELHDEHWQAMECELDARHDAARIDVFLRDVMRWWTGKLVSGSRTYDEFRRWAIREGRDNPERRPELCANLASLASLYGQLTGTVAAGSWKGVKREIDHLRGMGFDVHHPLSLRLLSDAQRAGESDQDPTWLAHTLGLVSSWITRLWLAGHSSTGLRKAFVELASASFPPDEADRGRFWARLLARVQAERCAVPSDSEVTEGIRLKSKYGGKDTGAARTVLCAITYRDTWGEVSCGKLTIEHIMPQTLTQAWLEDLGDQAEEIHARHLHRLGNLTLTGGRWGSALSNRRFEDKRTLYEKSAVAMTRELAGLPKWDEDAIKRRAEELAQRALEIWPWRGGA